MGWLDALPEPTLDENGWRAWTDYGVEVETAAFLYALVRLAKPDHVVESGTGEGYATVALAAALADNDQGILVTFEPQAAYREIAEARLAAGCLAAFVCPGLSCDATGWECPDVVFLDSYGADRPREIAYWLDKPVLLIVHDAREHRGQLPADGTFFSTPRGLWLRDQTSR